MYKITLDFYKQKPKEIACSSRYAALEFLVTTLSFTPDEIDYLIDNGTVSLGMDKVTITEITPIKEH